MEKANLIEINNLRGDKQEYRFKVELVKYFKEFKDGIVFPKQQVIIMLSKKKGKVEYKKVHPISEFLIDEKGSMGTQKKNAYHICRFLNYVFIDNGKLFNIRAIKELNFDMGNDFLNDLSCLDIERSTVERYEGTLKQLYFYLAKKSILNYVKINNFKFYINEKSGKRVIKSPFIVEYPSRKYSTGLIHDLTEEVVIDLMKTALIEAPRIALGMAMQFWGGLRVGEIVNIVKSGIKLKGINGTYGIVVNLDNRNLRRDLKHYNNGGTVKRKRAQAIFPVGDLLGKLYKNHIENYTNDSDALFIGKNDAPMTDVTYTYYFNKAKEKLIEKYISHEDINVRNIGVNLRNSKWSSHIGRGVFSNMLAEIAQNISQIAVARGDKSFESSLTYVSNTTKMAMTLKENNNQMWQYLLEDVEFFS